MPVGHGFFGSLYDDDDDELVVDLKKVVCGFLFEVGSSVSRGKWQPATHFHVGLVFVLEQQISKLVVFINLFSFEKAPQHHKLATTSKHLKHH